MGADGSVNSGTDKEKSDSHTSKSFFSHKDASPEFMGSYVEKMSFGD